jgi:uncharacterized protein (DUF1800 family)
MRRPDPDPTTLALHRFGLGARPGERPTVAADPRGWLRDQLDPHLRPPARLAELPSHAELFAESARRKAAGGAESVRQWGRSVYRNERAARFAVAASTPHPFRERWVRFWSNHLCVSAKKRPIVAVVGAHEREAIRPAVVGSFSDLLLASTRHPAMLMYLDNQLSVGPHSSLGESKEQGLNENLARELLELHTLGVEGGYSQDDVVALAKMLTGWTVWRGKATKAARETAFVFARRRHEPGEKVLLGQTCKEDGEAEAAAALRALARHPSTARHLSRKLVRHFVADDPPEPIVTDLARVFEETGGDLQAVGVQLIEDDRAWKAAARQPKLRTPEELAIAMVRASGWTDSGGPLPDAVLAMERAVQGMGQVPLSPPSPAGWPDRAEDWAGPEQVLRRIELAEEVGRSLRGEVRNPEAFADDLLGDRFHPDTRLAVARAPDRATSLALIFAAPEFQWR